MNIIDEPDCEDIIFDQSQRDYSQDWRIDFPDEATWKAWCDAGWEGAPWTAGLWYRAGYMPHEAAALSIPGEDPPGSQDSVGLYPPPARPPAVLRFAFYDPPQGPRTEFKVRIDRELHKRLMGLAAAHQLTPAQLIHVAVRLLEQHFDGGQEADRSGGDHS